LSLRKRSLVIGSLFVAASVLYVAARHYSPALVLYVVEQSLIQKAPAGIGKAQIRERFHATISAIPDQNTKMERLLQISEYLEKVQHLTTVQLDELLASERPGMSLDFPGFSDRPGGTGGNPVV